MDEETQAKLIALEQWVATEQRQWASEEPGGRVMVMLRAMAKELATIMVTAPRYTPVAVSEGTQVN